MRITTQMLNETARKTGLTFTCNTLLDQLNGQTTGNALLDALNNKSSSVYPNAKNRTDYEKLEKTADRLQKQAEKFTDQAAIWDKLTETDDPKDICSDIEALVKEYNSTLKELHSHPGTMNDFYQYMMKQAAGENKEALSNIGITVAKDGQLTIDKEKYKTADLESIRKALGGSEGFAEKSAFIAARISDNAQANARSASVQYNATGNTYSALLNQYDFRS